MESLCCTDTGVPRRRAEDGEDRKVARGHRAMWHGCATGKNSAALFRRLGFGLEVFSLGRLGFFQGGKTLLFRPYIKRVKPKF